MNDINLSRIDVIAQAMAKCEETRPNTRPDPKTGHVSTVTRNIPLEP